jgi:hypothetical protein
MRLHLTIHEADSMEAGMLPASPLGTLGPEGWVNVGALHIRGRSPALRLLAAALLEAAAQAEAEPPSQRALENE